MSKEMMREPKKGYRYPGHIGIHERIESCDSTPKCIPIPEQEYECTATVPCQHWNTPGTQFCKGCEFWQPKKPTTCSECGHKVADHSDEGCMADIRCDGALNTCGCSITRDALNQMAEHNLIQTKTQCEHEWHPITQGTWNCTKCGEPYYDTPADLQPELTLETLQEACSKMLVVDDSPYSKPEMPLSTVSEEIQAWVNEFGGERDALNIALARLSLANAIINRLKQQIDSSTNNEAHDSAVASKAIAQFAQQIIQGIEKLIADSREVEMASDEGKNCRSAYEQGLNEALAHIRAMAEKE